MHTGEFTFPFNPIFTLLGGLLAGVLVFLYLIIIPIMIFSTLPEKGIGFIAINIILDPLLFFGIYLYRRHRGAITLTDESITLVQGKKRKSIRLNAITAVRDADRHLPPNFTLAAGDESLRFSRKLVGFPYLYELLRDRVPAMRSGGPTPLPLTLDARKWYYINIYGTIAVICALWIALGMYSFSIKHIDNPIEVISIFVFCAAVMSLMMFFGFKPGKRQPVRITFDANSITAFDFWGNAHSIPLSDVLDMRIYKDRKELEAGAIALQNVEYPLAITTKDNDRVILDETFAKNCGTTVERLLFDLKDAYGSDLRIEGYRHKRNAATA